MDLLQRRKERETHYNETSEALALMDCLAANEEKQTDRLKSSDRIERGFMHI